MNCKKEIPEVHEQKSRKENLLYRIVSRVLHCTTRGGELLKIIHCIYFTVLTCDTKKESTAN